MASNVQSAVKIRGRGVSMCSGCFCLLAQLCFIDVKSESKRKKTPHCWVLEFLLAKKNPSSINRDLQGFYRDFHLFKVQ